MRKLLILSVLRRCSPAWLALVFLTVGLVPVRGQSTYQFAIPTYSVYENSSNVTVAVIRTGDVSTNGSVDFNTADGTAVAGLDYEATGGTLTFAPNEIVKSFDVIIVNNGLAEPDETVLLTLSNPQGGTNGAISSAQISIFDDDLQFSFNLVGTNVVPEANSNAIFVVTKGPFPSQAPASVQFSTANGTAFSPADYTGFSTNLVFTNGQTDFTVLIPIINDFLVESNETFTVALGSPVGGVLGGTTNGVVLIIDDDTAGGAIQFSFAGPTTALENIAPPVIRVRVSRLGGRTGQVSVDYEIFNNIIFEPGNLCTGQTNAYRDGSRTDYVRADGTLTWADQDVNDKFIDITVINDTQVELDESILIRLVRPVMASLGPRRVHTVNILNDDLPAGSSDTTYNTLGVLNPTPGANSTVYAVATYQDGTERTVIGGDFSAVNAIVRNGVARIQANGFVDTSFDPGSGADGFVSSLIVLTNGKVLVGGGFTSMDNISRQGIARLNLDGSLDTAFDPGAGVAGSVLAMALQSDGKVIIAGDFTSVNNVERHNVARLNDDGSLDASFDLQTGPNEVVYAVAVQSDGKVLIGGAFTLVNGFDNFMVARLETNGVVDTTWSPISGADNTVFALKIQADGRPIIGGAFSTYDGEMSVGVARLQTDGALDTTFQACRGMDGVVYALALQTNGQVIIGGDFSVYNNTSRSNYARLLADGAIDTGFLDSYYNQAAPGANSFIAGIGLQRDGNIVLGGGFSRIGGGSIFAGAAPNNRGYSPPENVEIRFNYARVIGRTTLPDDTAGFSDFLINSPGNLEFVQANYTIDENVNGGVLAVTLHRVNGGLNGAQVHYRTVNGSAIGNVDFTPIEGDALWADCSAGVRTIFIPITDNQLVDGNKNFFIELSEPRSFGTLQTNQPALGFNCRAEVTIVDNDVRHGTIVFSKPIFSVSETNATATINVIRTNGSVGQVTVQVQLTNGTAILNQDWSTSGVPSTITFQSGQTNKSFNIPILNDIFAEPEEMMNIRLYNVTGGATISQSNAVLLIFDNEIGKGSLSFSATDVRVNEGAGTASVTLRRTGGTDGTVSATVFSADIPPTNGAARAGVDYTGFTNTAVTFGPGVTNQTVVIPILTDDLVEGPERFIIAVTNPVGGASIGFISMATVTILDDDSYGKIGFSSASYYVNEEAGTASIDVIRTEGSAEEVTVDFAVTAGTATDVLDFTATNGTVTFGPGVTLQTIVLPIVNDGDLEGNETVLLTFDNFSKASPGVFTNTLLTIVDDEALAVPAGAVDTFFDPRPGPNQFVNALALQPDGKLIVGGTFTAFGGVSRPRIARLEINGQVDSTFAPGQGANGSVNAVALQPDGKVLLGGGFTKVGNRNRSGIARLTTAGALDTSFNPGAGADNPVNAMALQPDGKVIIVGGFATYNGVTRAGVARLLPNGVLDQSFFPGTGANGPVSTVALQSDGKVVMGGEFTTFNSLPIRRLVRLNVDGSVDGTFDTSQSPNSSVRSVVVQPDGRIVVAGGFTSIGGTARSYIARFNDDGTLDPAFDPGTGPNSLIYSVALQPDGKMIIGGEFTTVGPLTANRIARLTASGTIDTTIDFGTGANLFVSTVLIQPDAEIVIGGGFTSINGIARNYVARLVGGEDIGPGILKFTQASYTILESFTNLTVTIARVGGSQGQVSVDLVSRDDTATGDVDFGLVNSNLVFLDGEVIKTFTVGITNDLLIEQNEVFGLYLTNVMGATLNESETTLVTIIDDDSTIGFSQATYSVNERVVGGNAIITVVRVGATNGSVAVNYTTRAGGTATTNVDYVVTNGVLNFVPGVTSLTFSVTILNDLLVEGNETVSLRLSNVTGGAVLSAASASLIIVDDEFSPGSLAFSRTAYSAPEALTPLVVTINRTNGVTGAATVNWSINAGTATAGVDYSAVGGVLSFADGDSSKSITIAILDDAVVEGNETFTLTLANPTGGTTIIGPTTVTVTIEDDEFGPGSLDPTFSFGAGADDLVKSVAVAPDGKIAIGGAFLNFDGTNRPYIARLLASGALDLGFNPGSGASALVSGVGVFPDGRVAMGGNFTLVGGMNLNRVARLNTNGTVDTSFSMPSGLNTAVNALVALSNGNVVVVGGFALPTPGIARFRADGSVDTTFDPGTSINGAVQSVAVLANGQTLIGGSFSSVAGFSRQKVARLHIDGLLDQSFLPPTNNGVVFAMAGQSDGKVLIAGTFTNVGGQTRSRIARLNTNGTLDGTFVAGAGANQAVYAMVVQPDGRILIGGDFTSFNGTNRNRYARLNPNGSLDLSFDPGRGADDTVYSIALLNDGKLMLGGAFTMVNGFNRRGVARINGDTAPLTIINTGMTVDGYPSFGFGAQPGVAYVIEGTSDFVNWTALVTNVASGTSITYTETNFTFMTQQFYRVRRLSP